MGIILNAIKSAPEKTGEGWSIHALELRRGERHIIVIDRDVLKHALRAAREYKKHHDGKLPDTTFWRTVVDLRNEDPSLFALTHQCRGFLSLLRGATFEKPIVTPENWPPHKPPSGQPSTGPEISVDPPYIPPVGPHTSAVPEPASFILLLLGLMCCALGLRRRRRTRVLAGAA